jgi:hypothetical protein
MDQSQMDDSQIVAEYEKGEMTMVVGSECDRGREIHVCKQA